MKVFKALYKNVGDLDKVNVATGFEKLPKVQSIAQSGHTDQDLTLTHLVSRTPVIEIVVYT